MTHQQLEEGELVLCTVDKIIGTTVFVSIENNREGSIVVSEIAPGRIRNLRDYVVPKKKIVCKILRIIKDNVELSLRRVTNKEKKEVMDSYQLEKRYESILKTILGEKTESTVKKIKESSSLSDFIKEIKENPKKLETLVGKNESQKIIEILGKEKQKKSFVKKEINLKSKKPNGLLLIKEIFNDASKKAEINYIAAGKYSLKVESINLKKADQELQELIKEIERKSKKLGLEFSEKAKK